MLRALRARAKQFVLDKVHAKNQRRRRELGQERGLPPQLWGLGVSTEGRLQIGGCDSMALAEEFQTPLYVVDRRRLHEDYKRFYDSFRSRYPKVEIGYSYKTNPLPGVIQALHEFGAMAEVISHFELWLALQLGVPPAQIIFNGPAKTAAALEQAVSRRIKLINIDGFGEIDLIAASAEKYGVEQEVGVRVVTSVGWSAQFGLNLHNGEAFEAFKRLLACNRLRPVGLHAHLGTGIKDVPTYLQAIREMLEFAQRLRRELGVRITYLDFGGGFGVPTVQPFSVWDSRLTGTNRTAGPIELDATPSPADYAAAIVPLVRSFYPEGDDEVPTLAFEPGRAISSSAQLLLLRVLAVKPGRDGIVRVILNGGKNLALPTGYEHHEILPAGRMHEAHVGNVNFYGPLCHPGDVLFVQKPFPKIEVGDLVAVMDAGAYFVPNQMNFSNPRPAAVIVENGRAELIRTRESFEDIVRLDAALSDRRSTETPMRMVR